MLILLAPHRPESQSLVAGSKVNKCIMKYCRCEDAIDVPRRPTARCRLDWLLQLVTLTPGSRRKRTAGMPVATHIGVSALVGVPKSGSASNFARKSSGRIRIRMRSVSFARSC